MKHITVHKVIVKPGSLYSPGIGFDDSGVPVDFIGHTVAMSNINKALEDHEDFPLIGKPTIYLEQWQEVETPQEPTATAYTHEETSRGELE